MASVGTQIVVAHVKKWNRRCRNFAWLRQSCPGNRECRISCQQGSSATPVADQTMRGVSSIELRSCIGQTLEQVTRPYVYNWKFHLPAVGIAREPGLKTSEALEPLTSLLAYFKNICCFYLYSDSVRVFCSRITCNCRNSDWFTMSMLSERQREELCVNCNR